MPNESTITTSEATRIVIENGQKRQQQTTKQTTQQATRSVATQRSRWRLTPALRNGLLVLHVIMGIGWMGVDMAVVALLMTARTTQDATLVVSAFNAIAMIIPLTVPVLSLGILGTGLILGLGTRWGLIRYWWVLVKLLLSVVMTALVYLSLLPAISSMPLLSDMTLSADAVRTSLGELPTMLFFPPIVSFLMLGIATILSVFKPWRRTPWSHTPGSRDSSAGVANNL